MLPVFDAVLENSLLYRLMAYCGTALRRLEILGARSMSSTLSKPEANSSSRAIFKPSEKTSIDSDNSAAPSGEHISNQNTATTKMYFSTIAQNATVFGNT